MRNKSRTDTPVPKLEAVIYSKQNGSYFAYSSALIIQGIRITIGLIKRAAPERDREVSVSDSACKGVSKTTVRSRGMAEEEMKGVIAMRVVLRSDRQETSIGSLREKTLVSNMMLVWEIKCGCHYSIMSV